MWQVPVERLALLELLVRGVLKRRKAQADVYDLLADLPWTRATGRRDQIALVQERRAELVMLMDRVWATWGETLAELTARNLQPTPEGLRALEDARRAEGLPTLPELLNRKTAAALAAPHSKAVLTKRRMAALGATDVTHDGAIRLRPPLGLRAMSTRGAVDLGTIAEVLGEVSIPERAFSAGLAFEGPVHALLLVENLGAWRDLPAIEGWLYAHVPGWDTASVAALIRCCVDTPVIHFGDLDPNGIRIFQHLRERCPRVRWFVPDFWCDYLESKGQRGAWPQDLNLQDAPPLVLELRERELWLEQEPLVVDARLISALQEMV